MKTSPRGVLQWRATGQTTMTAWGCHHLGQVQRAQGRLGAAAETYQQALEITAPPGRPALPAAGAAHVGMAEVAFQRNDLDTALWHVTEGITLTRQFNYTQPLATGLAAQAWIRQALGDAVGALEAMGEAERAAPSLGVTDLLNPVFAQRARLLLAQRNLAAAVQWTMERGLDDEPSYAREPEYLVLARVLLAQDLPDQALGLLERLYTAAAAQRRAGSIIEIQALLALALAACGKEREAYRILADALHSARPEDYVRIFADEGVPMGALLARLLGVQRRLPTPAGGVPLDYLARLARACQENAALSAAPATSVVASFEPLSERELEVLRLMALGKQNRDIAEGLSVTPDTVKKHVTHILSKLSAANRTEATARARSLGLLS